MGLYAQVDKGQTSFKTSVTFARSATVYATVWIPNDDVGSAANTKRDRISTRASRMQDSTNWDPDIRG